MQNYWEHKYWLGTSKKLKPRGLCGKGQLGRKLHDVYITRTEKIKTLKPMIKGNETGHIYMQVQRNKNLINTIQAICNNKLNS